MAVLNKATSCSFIFGGVYIINGTDFVFCECSTDKIDEEMELHFVSNESLKYELHGDDDIFRSVIIGSKILFTLNPQCVDNVAKRNNHFIPFMTGYSKLKISEDNG